MIPQPNLIPRSYRIQRQRRRRGACWALAVGAWALLCAGAYLWCHQQWGAPSAALADDLSRLTGRIGELEQQAARLRPALQEASQALEAGQAVANQPDWSIVLALLARQTGAQVVLRSCVLEPAAVKRGPTGALEADPLAGRLESAAADKPADDRFLLKLTGLGQTQAAVQGFVLRLESSGLFDRVALLDTRSEPFLDGSAFGFRLECLLGPGKPRGVLP